MKRRAKKAAPVAPATQLDLTEADHAWLLRAYHGGMGCWYTSPTGMRRRVRLHALGLVNDLGSISDAGLALVMRTIREAGL